jgi:hypothetical protein
MLLRRQVLVVLRAVQGAGYDGWFSEEGLWRSLRTEAEDLGLAETREHLAYLAGKGYVERRSESLVRLVPQNPSARIAPKGIDLLDGVIETDPGVAP